MKTHTGIAKVKEDYAIIYKGYTLPITKIKCDYKNGNGVGVYADGTREYELSLMGTPFVKSHGYKSCVIHDSHLEIIELNETICLPFNVDETNRLIEFIKEDSNRTLNDFIKVNTKRSELPTPDLSTLYEELYPPTK
jgi:hypothetical protein|tara:strand:- start:2337 stop:2747 length:411 start_codon:yes stop_codon:yes gene_type:complete